MWDYYELKSLGYYEPLQTDIIDMVPIGILIGEDIEYFGMRGTRGIRKTARLASMVK